MSTPAQNTSSAGKTAASNSSDPVGAQDYATTPTSKFPMLSIANDVFLATSVPEERDAARERVYNAIVEHGMLPYLQLVGSSIDIAVDGHTQGRISTANDAELVQLDATLAEAEDNQGNAEIGQALINKADFFARIGDKAKTIEVYRLAFEKVPTVGAKIDVALACVRVGLFFGDDEIITANIEKARDLIEKGGDWDRRNRLKSYEGLYKLSVRDFAGATKLLVDSLKTFTSVELMDYTEFVKYAVLAGILSLPRVELKANVVDSPEVLEVIHKIPAIESLLGSLYSARYGEFFRTLAIVETEHLKRSIYLHTHVRYYVRELRIIAYAQQLESYSSLGLSNMASSFGVSQEFIERDLVKFIAAGRLQYSIDKVAGIVCSGRSDTKNAQFQQVLKQSDTLLNSIQKLSRVVNV
ncbi:PCI-domain-containing protein [Ramicandelaber brevisporus]|nr:PCI-domain-containing protein [Ramicandelaber brevisporus]